MARRLDCACGRSGGKKAEEERLRRPDRRYSGNSIRPYIQTFSRRSASIRRSPKKKKKRETPVAGAAGPPIQPLQRRTGNQLGCRDLSLHLLQELSTPHAHQRTMFLLLFFDLFVYSDRTPRWADVTDPSFPFFYFNHLIQLSLSFTKSKIFF